MKKILEILLERERERESLKSLKKFVILTNELDDSNYHIIWTLVNRKRIGN